MSNDEYDMENGAYIFPRHMEIELQSALKSSRVVNVIGPRQVGKTTLVRDLYGEGEFLTLDDHAILNAAEIDAMSLLLEKRQFLGDKPLIIDEIQRSKSLALAIKQIVDQDRRRGQFLLTGSSNVFATKTVSDSLAGRVIELKLWPLTISECKGFKPFQFLDWLVSKHPSVTDLPSQQKMSRDQYLDFLLAGGYPDIRDLPIRLRQRRYISYVNTIIERDVADVLSIRKPNALKRLTEQMAVRTSFELNVLSLAKLLGIQRRTVEQYLDVLTQMSMVIRLAHWTPSESKRDIKNAKYHFVDTGVVAALRRLNCDSFKVSAHSTALGGLMETFVFNEIIRSLPFQAGDIRLYHWRNRDKREIDIIVDANSHLVCIEVKSSSTVHAADFKHIKWFAQDGPGCARVVSGVVFYLGDQRLSFGDRCFALPISTLWLK